MTLNKVACVCTPRNCDLKKSIYEHQHHKMYYSQNITTENVYIEIEYPYPYYSWYSKKFVIFKVVYTIIKITKNVFSIAISKTAVK